MRGARFKLVERPKIDGGYGRSLYDLDSAAGETVDVTDLCPDIAADFGRALDDWGAQLPDFVAPERSASEVEVLRALGYVDRARSVDLGSRRQSGFRERLLR